MNQNSFIKIDKNFDKLIDSVEPFLRMVVMEKAMPAMVKPIIAKGKDIAPSSVRSGTRLKWGRNKTFGKTGKVNFDPVVWKKDNSGEHIGYKLRKYKNPIIYVGAKHTRGNKQQFLAPQAGVKDHVLWGKKTVKQSLPVREQFMRRAYDETRPQQESAFVNAFEKAVSGGIKIG